ncbi:MAG: CBS domain-containing protein [Halobacteriales archaeon]|nr:CBS domain-containing protein [Halobacteriales archaeon]
MIVADAMTPRSDLVVAELPGTREDVLQHLKERSFSSVPVVKNTEDGETFRGIVSRDDLIENPDEDQLALLMREVPTTSQDTEIEDLARMMVAENARRVPVVDGELEGIITITDVVRTIADGEVSADVEVSEIVSTTLNTTYCKTPLLVALREMYFANEAYAIVLDDEGDMDGIITEVDVIEVVQIVEGEEETGESIADEDDEWMWEGIKAVGNRYLPTRNVEIPSDPVDQYMTDDMVTVTGRRTIQEAAQLMIRHDIEQIPLVSGDELIGIVRDVDLLSAL